jgi:hypothetical protein
VTGHLRRLNPPWVFLFYTVTRMLNLTSATLWISNVPKVPCVRDMSPGWGVLGGGGAQWKFGDQECALDGHIGTPVAPLSALPFLAMRPPVLLRYWHCII